MVGGENVWEGWWLGWVVGLGWWVLRDRVKLTAGPFLPWS